MPDAQETQLIREATDIFLRLRDNPDDPKIQQERDEFLTRGEAERAAYQKMLRAWKVTETNKKPGSSTLSTILIAGLIFAAGYFSFETARIALFADLSTGLQTRATQLVSGDHVILDATSALIDETESTERRVTLLQGAAYFDVERNGRPFIVTVGDLRVEVRGTAFEVGRLGDGVIVTVTEGTVDVAIGDQTWQLLAGRQLSWFDDTGALVTDIEVSDAAGWREDTLVADGMTLGQIAAVLDRRVSGDILITNSALAQTPIVGTFDLSDPTASLNLLTELTGAKVTNVPYVMTIIRP